MDLQDGLALDLYSQSESLWYALKKEYNVLIVERCPEMAEDATVKIHCQKLFTYIRYGCF